MGPPGFTTGFYTSQVGGWPLGFLNESTVAPEHLVGGFGGATC